MIHCYALRLQPGQDLKEELRSFVMGKELSAAWIMTCVGSLTRSHLRYANREKGIYREGHFEILSLVGTLGMSDLHLHICLGDEEGKTFGGHLLSGNLIYTTAEIVLASSEELVFRREEDSATGYKELSISYKA